MRAKEPQKVLAFLEELSWLLASHSSHVDFRSIPELLRKSRLQSVDADAAVGSYASSNPNKHFLVGALPRVLMDESLFPMNEDIAEFAKNVMGVAIPRAQKKSRYELIGHIVCETDALNDARLAELVHALAAITEGGDTTKRLIRERHQANFGWNAIIRELATASSI